jgi:adenylylsulfate kinase
VTGAVIWFTGLPASGKTTLAKEVHQRLLEQGVACCVLDGDIVRQLIAPLLGYSERARTAFYGVLAGLAGELAGQGLVVLVPATAHREAYRERARRLAPAFLEVWVTTPLEECQRRDDKGLYAAARTKPGRLPGVGVPYERPRSAAVAASGGRDRGAADAIVAWVTESRRPGSQVDVR